MSTEQQIKKALEEIEMAETHMAEASKKYYSARKRLAGISLSTAPKRGSKLTKEQVSHVLAKRSASINRRNKAA